MSRSPHGGQPLSTALDHLVEALRALPGVGPKAASRMAFHLLEHDRAAARHLAQQLMHALEAVRHCESCNTFCDDALCAVCADPDRERAQLCVVESVADMSAMERVGSYKGLYFVLMGRLSPLDAQGPGDIGLAKLGERVADPGLHEVILATNFTAEGELTAHVVSELLKPLPLKVTRLARGVPAGSELEYVDLGTLAHALADRR